MAEQWKDLMGYEGYYQVSNHGKVRSLNRTTLHKISGTQKLNGLVLKPNKTGGGNNKRSYHNVTLSMPGIQISQEYVHTLVLITFIGLPPSPKHECNHKNGNGFDNHVDNLEWVTHSENLKHYYSELNGQGPVGELNGRAVLTSRQVVEIRNIYAAKYYSQREIGEMFNVSGNTISTIVRRKSWRHIP